MSACASVGTQTFVTEDVPRTYRGPGGPLHYIPDAAAVLVPFNIWVSRTSFDALRAIARFACSTRASSANGSHPELR